MRRGWVLILVLLVGCSSTRPNSQALKIDCNVPGAIVKVNGDTVEYPAEVQVRRDIKVTVEAYKDGYDKYTKVIDYHLSDAAKADLVGTAFLFFPVFGMLSPGAWDLDQTEVNIILNRLPSGDALGEARNELPDFLYSPQTVSTPKREIEEKLEALGDLVKKGLITEEEYARKKAQLLEKY